MTRQKKLKRGAVIFLKNNEHPFLVVSNNAANQYSPDVIALPMTSRAKRMDLRTHTIVNFHDSVVLAENILLIKKEDIRSVAHIINRESMEKVNKCLKHALQLKN